MEYSQQTSAWKYELLLFFMAIIWGTAYVAQSIGIEKGIPALAFNGIRFGLGALTLLPVIAMRRTRFPELSTTRIPLKGCILAGIFLFAAAAFQQIGLESTTCANAGFITGFYIIFVPVFAIAFGHKPTIGLWLGIIVSFIGFYFLSITDQFTILKGDVLILICAFLWTGQILVIDRTVKNADPIKVACVQFAVCAVLSLIGSALFEPWSMTALKAGSMALLYAGCVSAGLGFTLQVVCQKRCPPGPAAVIMSMEAVFAAIAGYLFLNQAMTMRSVFGASLMLVGMMIVQLAGLVKTRVNERQRVKS